MGSFFEWDAGRYGLGIGEMDDEHKVIIGLMNTLHALHEAGAPATQLAGALAELANYTARHFADEEAYMARIRFPGLDKHRMIHRTLLGRITDFKTAFDKSGRIDDALFPFLSMWLKAHICGIDIKYSEFNRMSADA
jgi:hemerythrin